jgi:transposase-like protein
MALSQSALSELLEAFRAGDGVDLVRESVRMMQELIEAEAAERIGAGLYERTDTRVTERNGSRPRLVTTQAGDIGLRIPKLRKGSFFPLIREPRRRIDQALYAVVMEAYVQGISTRSIDDLVEAMGSDVGISKSEVSRICAGLDETLGAFRTRTLDHVEFPYVYLDTTYLHVRNQVSQVTSMAVVVATGVTATGQREILGLDVGDSEDEIFWKGFMTSLKQRGLTGVKLVISDQHAGLVKALRRYFQGVVHQRCRVHNADLRIIADVVAELLAGQGFPVGEVGIIRWSDRRLSLQSETGERHGQGDEVDRSGVGGSVCRRVCRRAARAGLATPLRPRSSMSVSSPTSIAGCWLRGWECPT